jgi:HK97 family phage major capsid protein
MGALGDLGTKSTEPTPEGEQLGAAGSLGAAFVKHLQASVKERGQRFSVTMPEYKAATDIIVTGGAAGALGSVLTDVDTTIVTGNRPAAVVADLLGQGTISGSSIRYFVEGAREGDFAAVGENGQKPQMSYGQPTPVVESLKKIAGFIKESDELIDDLPFWVDAINSRLLYDLAIKEQAQLLSGDGNGNNLTGILSRAIGEEAAVNEDDNADALFRAITKVQVESGLNADGLVIHPIDYQLLRLSRDANEQYYGGGFFTGAYGQAGMTFQPPIWGLRTVVTPAIPVGTALVGAFRLAATLYRKGGVSVEMTNSNEDDFTNNRVTVRAEERIALAVRRPAGFCKVDLDSSASSPSRCRGRAPARPRQHPAPLVRPLPLGGVP